jgi:hypothetical protein
MQTNINPMIAVAAAAAVLIVALGIFFLVQHNHQAAGPAVSPVSSTAYTSPSATNHP